MKEEPLYPIGEVARVAGVSIKTIRYYSDIGLLPPAETTSARYRLYATADIWRLQLIRVLRQVGFGLEDIRALLAGEVSVATAIDWQLEAVEGQIRQLSRVQAILQQAQQQEQNGQNREVSLRHLHDLSLALDEDATERGRFVTGRLRALVLKSNLPDKWREHMLEHFTWEFPATFTAEQAAAWAEMVSILNNPSFAEEALRFNTLFVDPIEQSVDVNWYNERSMQIFQQAQEYALRGVSGEDPSVQQLVRDWLNLIATLSNRPITRESVRDLARLAPTFHQEQMQRFWTLLTFLCGYEPPMSYEPAYQLLAEGLLCYERNWEQH